MDRSLERALAQRIKGEVHTDRLHRLLFACDASLYAVEPLGVVYPKDREDVVAIVRFAAQHQIPLTPRAAGTSLSGQSVGPGLVVDVSRFMGDLLEIDLERGQARLQPGVILDDLNRALAPHGLFFGPDTSTANRCMIGGMVGNNSSGSHSILYGDTRAHVLEVEMVLADGSVVRFGAEPAESLEACAARPGVEGAIHRGLLALLRRERELILERFPDPAVKRRNMGYALDALALTQPFVPTGPAWNVAALVCGSEGTLGIVTEITVGLVPLPRHKSLVVLHFDDLESALTATVQALPHEPAAIELIDKRTLDATKDNLEQARNRAWLVGDPDAVLVVEFFATDAATLAARVDGFCAWCAQEAVGYAQVRLSGSEAERVWALRKAGLGLLMGLLGDVKALTLVEDTAVAVADLPRYIAAFRDLLARHQTACVYYAHASVGELHLRPELNPKKREDMAKAVEIAGEVADLVRDFRGTITGEHGDGRVRSPFLARVLGAEVVALFAEVKALFDPQGLFNPRVIVDPEPMDTHLRYPPGREVPEITSRFSFAREGGLFRAVENCNGAGVCRKPVAAGGTMCPSYMATGDERHSTRGRANVIRQLLLAAPAPEAMRAPELEEVMAFCLSCKACKSECPANVDMARLKSELLYLRRQAGRGSRAEWLFGKPDGGYRLAQRFSGLANAWLASRLGKALMARAFGVDPRRSLPPFARDSAQRLLAQRRPGGSGTAGEVVLFVDTFTAYQEPWLALAAVDVLESAGWQVHVARRVGAARPQLSKGYLDEARTIFEALVAELAPYAARGLPILGIEPSEVLGLLDEAPDLVAPAAREAAWAVARQVDLVDVFVGRALAEGRVTLPFNAREERVLLHGHCHHKALLGIDVLARALRAVPCFSVEVIPSGCCGMAGSFGYEKKSYELSMRIGEQVLFPAVRAAAPEAWIAAAGTSCRQQIVDGCGREAYHPIELIRYAFRGDFIAQGRSHKPHALAADST